MRLTTNCWTGLLANVRTARFIKAIRSESACGWLPEVGISRVLCRCGRIIGHVTVRDYAVTGVPLFVFAFLVSSCAVEIWRGRPKADVYALPRVITK